MKTKLYRYVLVVFLLLTGWKVQAQSRYRFYTLGVEQGLTSNVVWSICKDKFGYVWMATQHGLNRYDGHRIKQYFHNSADSFSIPGNVVYWIHKDVRDGLWFVFGNHGVARYNPARDRFERFAPLDSVIRKNGYGTKAWRMCNDQQGRIYIANGSSCFRYSLQSQKIEDLTPLFQGALQGYDIGMFVPQGKDVLWITTNNGLFRYDLMKNSMQHFPFDAKQYGWGDANMHDAEFVNDHELLIAVMRTGFVLFDINTHRFRLPPAPVNPTQSKKFSETGGVLKDARGRIWMANSRYGLLEYLPRTNTVYSLKNEPSYPYPFAEQEGSGLNVYEDDEGNIWYGSSGKGVIWFKPEMDFLEVYQRDYSQAQSLPGNYVSYFLPLEKETMLIGTANGVTAFDRKTNQFRNFPVALNKTDQQPQGSIRGLLRHRDSVFITTGYGLSVYELKTGRFSRYIDPSPVFDSLFIYGQWLLHYAAGQVFVSGRHFAAFDFKKRRYRYSDSSEHPALLHLSDINASLHDTAANILWAESETGKLYAYHWPTKTLKRHLYTTDSVFMIDALQKDEQGWLWIGTSSGLYRYDPVTATSEKIILNTSETGIYNIAIQNQQYVWLTTQTEVVRYDRRNKRSEILPIQTFLPYSSLVKRSFLLDTNGLLWLGTTNGFATIDTKRFHTSGKPKQPQVVSFSVFDKEKVFEKAWPEVDGIELAYNENFFSFSLSAFNFHGPVEYSYRLEGFDKDWQPARGNSGSYTNVPPGVYRLRIKSTNEAGGWMERSSPVVIKVKPPFWLTWWFLTLLAVGLALSLALAYSLAQKRRRKKQIEETIDYFANSLQGESSISEICWDIARNCISQLKLEDCAVYLLDDKTDVLVQQAAFGPRNPEVATNPLSVRQGDGIVGRAAATGKAVLVKGWTNGSRYRRHRASWQSELAVPIIHEGKAIGVIEAEHPRKNFFTEEHVKAMSTIAAISASKIAEARAEENARESEIQLLEIKRLLAESQLMALRAQMNPHFVFNCLNSIQECIVTQKYGEASLYLNKFAKLFRSVLNNSGKVMVTLAEEIEVLDLYLSLEHMRFEQSFTYTIYTDEELEADEILIPSMLVQPYVENALWHGLMHKQGERKLCIAFTKKSDAVFECVIDDNGIGRRKAMELKEQQSKTRRHVSKGMTISQDRIELLQKQGQHALLQIVDKYEEDGEAAGTKVVMELSSYLQ